MKNRAKTYKIAIVICKNWSLAILLFVLPHLLGGQSIRLSSNSRYNHFVDRLDIVYGLKGNMTSSIKPYDSKNLSSLAFDHYTTFSNLDQYEAKHLINQYDFEQFQPSINSVKKYEDSLNLFYSLETEDSDANEIYESQNPLLCYFYKNPHHLISIDAPQLSLRINPLLELSSGYSKEEDQTIFKNTRGIRVEGYIDNKIYLFTEILENQARFNNYIEEFINEYSVIPGNGLYKSYNSNVIKSLSGYDYLNAQGYVGLPISKSVSIEFGHGRHFIGNGIRSLLLSDFANNYFYLKFNTRVWKLNYQNIFAELNALANANVKGDHLIPKKYMANHYLTFDLRKNLELGLFETVIFSRENHFEFQYLNPIILYRTVEHSLGSPDNVILGLNLKWNPLKGVSLYGQFGLDEFNLGFFNNDGWWANKYAIQMGAKYFNIFGIDQLDGQVEFNYIRPYTYSHNESIDSFPQFAVGSYSHYNQSLAHPLGANLQEFIFDLRYRVSPKISLSTRLSLMKKGVDAHGDNYGGNILLVNTSRLNDFGNFTLQGNERMVNYARVNATYEVFKNYYIDANLLYRSASYQESVLPLKTLFIGLGVRANISSDEYLF